LFIGKMDYKKIEDLKGLISFLGPEILPEENQELLLSASQLLSELLAEISIELEKEIKELNQ